MMTQTQQIKLPPKLIPVFNGDARYRVAHGGRGSGKTRAFALMAAVRAFMWAEQGRTGVILCAREFQNSLDESSMEEVKNAIRSVPWLDDYFEIGERYIRTKNRRIKFVFAGLRHNLDSLKSKAGILLCWIDEAEPTSEVAYRKLIPTIRESGSEIWVTYNPESPDSPTHLRFRENTPDNCKIAELNWADNPWFPAELDIERQNDLKHRPDIYQHVWEGDFLTLTEAQIFAGCYEVRDFEVSQKWDGPYQGGDWGYAQDPTVAVQAYICGDALYIAHEAGDKGIELDDVPRRIGGVIPDFARHECRWDSAQPSMISHVKSKGLPRSVGAKKGKGSVEDGIQFIRSFKRVIIHPRCKGTIREFQLYSWKVDARSGEIRPDPVDANNHYIDALRYALEPIMRRAGINWGALA